MGTNLFGFYPSTPVEIIESAPLRPCSSTVLLSFSGGNDSRVLAHVMKCAGVGVELAAIDTGLSMDGWRQSVFDFAEWVDLPLSFWQGEGVGYYRAYVEKYGFPGVVAHRQIQNRLKGRAYHKMFMARRVGTEGVMKANGVALWILSGIRKSESRKRELLTSPYSYREGALFVNPLFYWSSSDVADYLWRNNIPEAPGRQWDCKCGATVADPKGEWREIREKSPRLHAELAALERITGKCWGRGGRTGSVGQLVLGMDYDDNTIDSYPVCIGCVNEMLAKDVDDWGL